jgi:hypothetical protein
VSRRIADERRELEEAGWEPRGEGARAIWRRPEGARWYAHYQALAMLREERLGERLDALEKIRTQGGAA